MSGVSASEIARVAYEAQRCYARALREPPPPPWDEAPPRLQLEAIAGAEAVLTGRARSGAHLHDAWLRRAGPDDLPRLPPGYAELHVDQRRKVLLFRAVVLALVDGPCNGFCHDDACSNLDDHACHLDTCMSRFGVPPGLWRPRSIPAIQLWPA
jgi:hypothetical protein